MKRVVPSRTTARGILALCAFVAVLLAAACAPDANISIISPELGAQLAAIEAGGSIVREPTPVPPKLAELTPEQVFAGMPEDLAAAVQAAVPADGATIALSVAVPACVGCHLMDPAIAGAGPTWHNVGDTAVVHAMRAGIAGPAEYLHHSIIAPGDFVVPGFTSGIMPETYEGALSQDDLATLIAYLLSLNGQP